VRFLVDQNRSPRLAELLNEVGHDAVHTLDRGLEHADDDAVLALADAEHRVVITGDTDFGALLALARTRSPSVILFRARNLPRASDQAQVILRYLDDVADDLSEGAVVVITDARIRVRRLPLLHDG
jgi:predicted nuclease of predicted toxin-antitoxin system